MTRIIDFPGRCDAQVVRLIGKHPVDGLVESGEITREHGEFLHARARMQQAALRWFEAQPALRTVETELECGDSTLRKLAELILGADISLSPRC